MLGILDCELLKIINAESPSGYKVFEFSELIISLPQRLSFGESEVRESVKRLSEKEYISVKYEDEKEVCLSLLNKGRQFFENILDGEIEKARCEKVYFLYSFLGGALGSGLISLVFGVILALLGGR